MKKVFILILMFFALVSCSRDVKIEQLYKYGLEMTKLMETLVKDEKYIDFLEIGEYADFIDENVVANDYDSPIKVYEITKPNPEKILEHNKNSNVNFETLSTSAKEQICNRIGYSSICVDINSKKWIS